VGAARDRLTSSFSAIGFALNSLNEVKEQMEIENPNAIKRADRREVEAVFSVTYTTEWEREVLRAALAGAPLPVAQQNVTGNSVELF
jgi:hypothetical protein